MTLNYEPEGEPPKERLDASTGLTLLARLIVGLGKTHGPAFAEDACPCLGAVTECTHLSDRTMTWEDLVSGEDGSALLLIMYD